MRHVLKRSVETLVLWIKRAVFFAVLIGSGWLVDRVFVRGIVDGDNVILGFVGTWALAAYIILPRINRLLTNWYLPNYFMGRVRTADGLLGDPVNLAFFATKSEIIRGMKKAGWHQADDLTFRSGLKTIQSVVLRASYARAPVSSLYLFGRKQDFAFQQEVAGDPRRRHHVRFWRCPPGWSLPGGYKVQWLAAATYDRSVGFSSYTLQITHKIAENTDEERDYVIATLKQVDRIQDLQVLKEYTSGYHARNGGGDAIRTDGDMPMIHL